MNGIKKTVVKKYKILFLSENVLKFVFIIFIDVFERRNRSRSQTRAQISVFGDNHTNLNLASKFYLKYDIDSSSSSFK